ncbi:hypothetical protein ACK8OR_05955 [Jannaschia sp. KMU-145]|uniref:hypothetical protein n=1 Tax=Jannaschia halovivens TaxID=3388667 RepID=UPI00396B3FD2
MSANIVTVTLGLGGGVVGALAAALLISAAGPAAAGQGSYPNCEPQKFADLPRHTQIAISQFCRDSQEDGPATPAAAPAPVFEPDFESIPDIVTFAEPGDTALR